MRERGIYRWEGEGEAFTKIKRKHLRLTVITLGFELGYSNSIAIVQ